MTNLLKYFTTEGKQALQKDLKLTNMFAVPTLRKIVVHISLGEALANKKVVESVERQLSTICGQKPVVTRARKDISAFKLRRGEVIGIKVTLRGSRMYTFLEKLVKIVLPRIRDFRGIPDRGFDKQGNFTLGLSEQTVFSELEYSDIDKMRGLEITFVTSAKTAEQAKKLLIILGLPFEKEKTHGKTI